MLFLCLWYIWLKISCRPRAVCSQPMWRLFFLTLASLISTFFHSLLPMHVNPRISCGFLPRNILESSDRCNPMTPKAPQTTLFCLYPCLCRPYTFVFSPCTAVGFQQRSTERTAVSYMQHLIFYMEALAFQLHTANIVSAQNTGGDLFANEKRTERFT